MKKLKIIPLYFFALLYFVPVLISFIKSLSFNEQAITLGQYWHLFVNNYTFFKFFWNSVFYSAINSIVCILISLPLGFFFAKIKFRGKNIIFFFYILIMMLPLQSTMLSSYILLRDFELLNKPLALMLPMMFSPLAVFLFRQFIKVIPNEVIDYTLLETSSALKMFRYVIIPQIKPALITLFILIFCESWNMVEQAIIFVSKNPEIMPLSVKLSDLPENVYFAGSVIYMFPIIVMFLLFENEIEKGMESYKW